MHNGRQSFSDDALTLTSRVLAKWVRSIVPSGRRSMAVILPVDVCKAAGVEPGISSASVYQLDSDVGEPRGENRFLDFHIRIEINPGAKTECAGPVATAKSNAQ
jgi:hypothetical protein